MNDTLIIENVAPLFTSFNMLNFGYELLPLSLAIFLSFCITNNKRDFSLSFVFIYLMTFIIGWAREVWILVVVAIMVGIFMIKTRGKK